MSLQSVEHYYYQSTKHKCAAFSM